MKQTLKKMINNISTILQMEKDELEQHQIKISVSELDTDSKKFLYRAIDLRLYEIGDTINPMIVNSEFNSGEIDSCMV